MTARPAWGTVIATSQSLLPDTLAHITGNVTQSTGCQEISRCRVACACNSSMAGPVRKATKSAICGLICRRKAGMVLFERVIPRALPPIMRQHMTLGRTLTGDRPPGVVHSPCSKRGFILVPSPRDGRPVSDLSAFALGEHLIAQADVCTYFGGVAESLP